MALVLQLTDSATAVGGVLVLRLAPTVLAGPVAARLVTRWNRRKIMLAMDAVRIPAVAILPWVTSLWWIYLWAFVVELAGMVFLPARDASIPDLVDGDDDLATANGLVLGTSYGMIPVGAGLFALVTALAGGGGWGRRGSVGVRRRRTDVRGVVRRHRPAARARHQRLGGRRGRERAVRGRPAAADRAPAGAGRGGRGLRARRPVLARHRVGPRGARRLRHAVRPARGVLRRRCGRRGAGAAAPARARPPHGDHRPRPPGRGDRHDEPGADHRVRPARRASGSAG